VRFDEPDRQAIGQRALLDGRDVQRGRRPEGRRLGAIGRLLTGCHEGHKDGIATKSTKNTK
jgi:hypothetical protein